MFHSAAGAQYFPDSSILPLIDSLYIRQEEFAQFEL
jgi:hypothetical protein